MRIALALAMFLVSSAAYANPFTCGDLAGKTFVGLENQGGTVREDCENCHTDGLISFRTTDQVQVIWPSNYIAADCSYDASRNPVVVACEPGGAREFVFSEDCSQITWRNFAFQLQD